MRAEPQEWDDTKAQKRGRLGGHRVGQGPSIGLPPSFHVLAVNSASSEPTGGLRAPALANTQCRLSVCWDLRAHIRRIYCLGLWEAVPLAGPAGQATSG